ncbi:hypothetical protein [Sporosarcina sp. Te-1]|uniref:hypothetical protein n=1 Tax=Sporosarcina sp. Te-1 TaxID=2818390 RepID=UPI001A9F7AC9|nr:hypothetical protein [Sporosarcina sp. Te-1]QTD43107.1 hypothetical protein J3U78_10370 [Sporosarcina sp. Te-1]
MEIIRETGKPNKLAVTAVLILMLLVLGLAYFFNIYPGGIVVSEDTPKQMTITKQYVFGKESLTIEVEHANQLKVSLVKMLGEDLELKWYIIVLFFTALLFNIFNLVRNNHSSQSNEMIVILYLWAGVNLLACIIFVYQYINQVVWINDMLQQIS